ncbi:MAG: hypothetical protein J0L72_11150 [Armatimonadetes bacterium]|nr:hypothetical protein [Armatimonadota bacterium]
MRIEGKVAKLINSRELVINRGRADGVTIGMIFKILEPGLETIKDPDSGEVLGAIEREKVQVKVDFVDERLCVAKTFRYSETNIGGRGLGSLQLSQMFDPPKIVRKYEQLSIVDTEKKALNEATSYVKVGDPAVQAISELE